MAEEANRLLERLVAGERLPPPVLRALADRVESRWPADFAEAADCRGLIAEPATCSARRIHLDGIRKALSTGESPTARARLSYHARWLLHLGDPGGRPPRVSIVIPIYNRAALALEAVATSIDQTYRNIEIIAVDDGSTDDVPVRLAALADRVRVLRQVNRGVSAARNAGIAAATGEFVQFLDSDNLLEPSSVADKVQAFATVPDAELCYCGATDVSLFGVPPVARGSPTFFPEDDDWAPARDLLTALVNHQSPFLVTSVMVPRWVLLDAGPFDEDLATSEDTRCWFRLALRGTKAIGLAKRLFYRCRMSDSLSVAAARDRPSASRASIHTDGSSITAMRNLLDLTREPRLWTAAGHYVHHAARKVAWRLPTGEQVSPAIERERARLIERVLGLGATGVQCGRSPLPLLIMLAMHLDAIQQGSDFQHRLAESVSQAIEASSPMTAADYEDWASYRRGPILTAKLARVLDAEPSPAVDAAVMQQTKVIEALSFMRQHAVPHMVAAADATVATDSWKPLATIAVPVLDNPEAAESTIDSCLAQSVHRIHVLVLDGNRERVTYWSTKSRRVEGVVLSDSRGGLAHARNAALQNARAPVIRLLRPGDRLASQSIAHQLSAWPPATEKAVVVELLGVRSGDAELRLDKLVAGRARPPLSALLLPRALARQVGGFDEVLGEAHEMHYLLRLAMVGPRCLITHRDPHTRLGPAKVATEEQELLALLANIADAVGHPHLLRVGSGVILVPRRPPKEPPPTAARRFLVDRLARHVIDRAATAFSRLRADGRDPPRLTKELAQLAGAGTGSGPEAESLVPRILAVINRADRGSPPSGWWNLRVS